MPGVVFLVQVYPAFPIWGIRTDMIIYYIFTTQFLE